MCSRDQSLVTLAFLWEKLSQTQFCKDLTRKTAFFEGWSRFKFNNLGLSLGTNFKFYTSLGKGLKLKVRKVWEVIPTFAEVTGEKRVGGAFLHSPPQKNPWIWLKLTLWKTSLSLLMQIHAFFKRSELVFLNQFAVCLPIFSCKVHF